MSGFDVTVVIPTYRRSRFLGEAVESAYRQEGCRVQVVVVDDGTPEPPRREAHWPDTVELHLRPHGGRVAARNFGASQARAPFICFHDDDDGLLPGHIRAHLDHFARRPELGVSYCQTDLRSVEGQYLRTYLADHQEPADAFAALADDNIFAIHAAVVRKEWCDRVGGFAPELDMRGEDYDFWLRIAGAGAKFGFLPQRLCWVRQHANSSSSDLLDGVQRILTTKLEREQLLRPLARDGRPWWLARSYYTLGRAALEARDFEKARKLLRQALDADPSHLHARAYLALASGGGAACLGLLQRLKRKVTR